MKTINDTNQLLNTNGGDSYSCALCNYTTKSYWKTYSHVVGCVIRNFGSTFVSLGTKIAGFIR